MDNKINGVKIMVNKKKKVNLSNNPTPKKVKKVQTVNKQPPGIREKPKKNSGNVLHVIISIVITALIIGGIVYGWQNVVNTKNIEQKEQEAQNLKYDLEEMLNKTKSELAGTENEINDLKKTNEELKAKAEILNVAKRQYISSEYGFSFFYPATFGEAAIEIEEGEAGKKIIGKFSGNEKLIFGGITGDYTASSSSIPTLLDTQGFRKRWNSYYLKSFGSDIYEINPLKVIEIDTEKAVLIDKNSFVLEEGETPPVDIGENIGFLVNLENEEFSGIAFLNSDISLLPTEEFEILIKTIKNN